MKEIRYLTRFSLFGLSILAVDVALAREPGEPIFYKSAWACGPSLLPCRAALANTVNTLPYWRGNAPARPIRANYTPAFTRTPR
jgi:hypothetical protein